MFEIQTMNAISASGIEVLELRQLVQRLPGGLFRAHL